MSEKMLWPLPPRFHKVTSPFGSRIHPIKKEKAFHSGVDIACDQGTAIRAPFDGEVVKIWMDYKNGGGLSMKIEGEGIEIGFCHLSKLEIGQGEEFERGEVIAYSGGTPRTYGAGKSTGPHLHMTCRMDGHLVDPLKAIEWGDWF